MSIYQELTKVNKLVQAIGKYPSHHIDIRILWFDNQRINGWKKKIVLV